MKTEMRARARRRRFVRRVTIIASLAVVGFSLAVGAYYASTLGGPSPVDSKIGQPVSSTDISSMYSLSLQPYGPAPSASLSTSIRDYPGAPFVSGGKPVIVYIGADYCPYCAIQRWPLIMSLMRFGNFTDLRYMASAPGEGDYATFSFAGSSYSSNYVVFRPYENEDRNRQPLQIIPSNYSVAWQQFGSAFPFTNLGDKYVVSGSMISQPGLLQGKDWTQILADIKTGDNTGTQIKQAANLITSLICKLTNNTPSTVCTAPPIGNQVVAQGGPAGATLLLVSMTRGQPARWAGLSNPGQN